MGDNAEIKTGSSTSKPPTDEKGGPIIKEFQESGEYQQDLQVVLGTAFGVIAIVGLIAVTLLLYRVYKARQRALTYSQNDVESLDRNINLDIDGKAQSVVLLLYSYDCPLHQRVVEALAGFLMEACGVTVSLDVLEESDIADRGIDDWLVDRLQEADYILVVCSLGARLRCSKKHLRFKHDDEHILPDYFAVAVDYVAEKMRVERQKGLCMNKFMVAFMEYSTRSDIPPQLETATQFCLMRDVHKLHLHLNTYGPESDKSDSGSQESGCENHYHETETGALLKATIEQTKVYFKDNPSWMADRLEQSTISHLMGRGGKARKKRRSSLEQPLLVLTGSPWNYDPIKRKDPSKGKIYELNCGHFSAADLSNVSSMPPPADTHELAEVKRNHSNPGIYQNRQNSLPSSLASSGLTVPHIKALTSKSMDSFCTSSADHEGVPCLFCGSWHMDGRPVCKNQERPVSFQHQPSQESLSNNLQHNMDSSCSQTVLHAEVHQEWGTPVRGHTDGRANTFGGELPPQASDCDPNSPALVYQSLPPHHPVPNSDWSGTGKLRRWQSGLQDSPNLSSQRGLDMYVHGRKLSQSSAFTDDSGSISDTDSLERDLRSIQNISSFHDFVNSSSFVSRHIDVWHHEGYLTPSLTTCPSGKLSRLMDKDSYKCSGGELELQKLRSSPIV